VSCDKPMRKIRKLYDLLVCNKFSYLLSQVILFVLILTLDSYGTPENQWGVVHILRVSLIFLCALMILRFNFLNFSKIFIGLIVLVSCFSIFYNEIVFQLIQRETTKSIAEYIVNNNVESITTFVISFFVIISLTSEQRSSKIQYTNNV